MSEIFSIKKVKKISSFKGNSFIPLNNSVPKRNERLIDVYVTNSYSYDYLLISLSVPFIRKRKTILINDIIEQLSSSKIVDLTNNSISYRIIQKKDFYLIKEQSENIPEEEKLNPSNENISERYFSSCLCFVGKYPLENKYSIPIKEGEILNINLRPNLNKEYKSLIMDIHKSFEEKDYSDEEKEEKEDRKISKKAIGKRNKERKIKHIIRNLYVWKKLSGIEIKVGKKRRVKITKKDAASLLGYNIKTLNRDLEDIEKAKYFGFDFEFNKNKRNSFLKRFIKYNQGNKLNRRNIIKFIMNNYKLPKTRKIILNGRTVLKLKTIKRIRHNPIQQNIPPIGEENPLINEEIMPRFHSGVESRKSNELLDEDNMMLMPNNSERMNKLMDYYLNKIFQS